MTDASVIASPGIQPQAAPSTIPTFAERVAAVDAIEVASRIMTMGKRAAIGASTADIVAMAQRLIQLSTLASLTSDMLSTLDNLQLENDPACRAQLRATALFQVGDVGAALESLGYGRADITQPNQEEGSDEQG